MADLSLVHTTGGQTYTAVAAGVGTADVVVSAVPGRACKIMHTAAGTSAIELYDHASASSGATLIWKGPATPAAGDIVTLNIPVANGIIFKQTSGSAAVTISFVQDAVGGSGKDRVVPYTTGGQNTSYHAAGSSGAAAAHTDQGRLCQVVVLTSGSAGTDIYDHASAASGTKVFTLKANPTVGDVIDVQMPVSNGLYVAGATNTSSILVTYNKNAAYGR